MEHFDDILNSLLGSTKKAQFSEEEIDDALKRQKKYGGTFMDNLTGMTGRQLNADYDLTKELDELNKNLAQDFGDLSAANLRNAQAVQQAGGIDLSLMSAGQTEEKKAEEPVQTPGAESFAGADEKVKEKVFGQDELVRKLLIAFKRPFVLPEEGTHARNTVYLTGPEDSGKHTALRAVAEELSERKLLASPDITVMDLSVYKAAGQDNVFLQDLYAALMAKSQIILFENFDACHSSYLTYLSDLVIKGSCRLSERYILQKGQLVNVTNSFASETVSTFTPQGKYLVFVSTKKLSKLADAFGAPFVNAVGDVCESKALDAESCARIADREWTELKDTAEKRLSFLLSADPEIIRDEAVRHTEKGAGTAGLLAFFDTLLKTLAGIKLERDLPEKTEIMIEAAGGTLAAKLGEETINLMELAADGYTGEIDEVKKEMDSIVGLTEVKDYILSLEEYYGVQKRRKEAGLKTSEVSKHMIFTGNPGTGKTTIARIVSRYLKAIGVLSGGQLVEVTRADLVGRYVGHTAPLTNQVIKSAIGGVLFIDEAYSLYRGKDDTFGLEAIDTLVKGIEDNRDDLIVILAGYSKEMAEFLEANSGLKSRFPNQIHFPDYTGEELLKIAEITASGRGYTIEDEAKTALLTYFNMVQAFHADTAGNGRLVRNKLEEAILNQSRRLAAEPEADLTLLTSMDFDLTDMEEK